MLQPFEKPTLARIIAVVGAIIHLPADNLFEQLSHLKLMTAVGIKGIPGVIVHFLQFFRRHMLGLKNDLVGGIFKPVI